MRAAWAIVAVGALVVSYVACQNTWRGVAQDTEENAALAKQKAKDAGLDEKARAVGEEAREVARKAGDEIKKVAGKLTGKAEAPPVAPSPTDSTPSNAAREVGEAIGKVAAKAQETGQDIAGELKGAAVHLQVDKALTREASLDSSHIDVDVEDESKTVVLRGSVPDAAHKGLAARIAAEHSSGYRVRNELATIPVVKR